MKNQIPFHKVIEIGHFDEYEEPSTWHNDINKVMDIYNAMNSKKDMARLIYDVGMDKQDKYSDTSFIDECIGINMNLMEHVIQSERNSEYINGYDLFGDGYIFITYE